ncbi:DUF1634 domain-containing protein [Mucilaginibacter aquaedulcis]|jgi:uncharacterized membrane protein|uniref:DUF1634 domain-containing protein n=1 Tax=Mucilaginibacter aquaedulcis TaxID=1187081 RepID=UPI0025B497DD|nr:DUF1634 domain-containing protein [Mucilaginibacter aquaedulcis]MDN3549820.1 DUF1634 domain-containing protein [Mucilaginibacter aquaedulcis]
MSRFKDTDMQAVIGWILRLGVLLSMSIIFIGGIIYLYRHGHIPADYHTFKGVPDFVHNAPGIFNGVITFRGRAIIQAGIILLIATPILRVVFSAIGFILERDYLYTGITILVLLIITASMLSGHAG